MVKIIGPLHSDKASGLIGPRIVFSQRKTGQQARFQKAQADSSTVGREAQRLKYQQGVAAWGLLTEEEKETYKELAKNEKMSGYNFFMIGYLTGGAPPIPKQFEIDTDGTLLTGLISYFKLDSDGSDFWGNNHLLPSGNVSYGAGKVGNGVVLDGGVNSFLGNTNPSGLPVGNSNRSISVWFKCTQYPGGGADYPAFPCWGTGSPGQTCATGLHASDNYYSNYMGFFGYAYDLPAYKPNLSTWYHLIGTYDGTTVKLYVNEVEYQANLPWNTVLNAAGLRVGRNTVDGDWKSLIGTIDEIGIWEKVLSAQERADLYNAGNGQTMIGE